MSPHSFVHIYELFATFTLAYIIVDELGENPFVSIITEKIMRKYHVINDTQKRVRSQLAGHKESLESIRKIGLKKKKFKNDYPNNYSLLLSIESRANNYFERIGDRIKRNSTSVMFVFINCFLLLYCLSLIFIGGLYDEHSQEFIGTVAKTTSGESVSVLQPYGQISEITHNLQLDNSIFFLLITSLIFLIVAWSIDQQRGFRKKTKTIPTTQEIEQVIDEGSLNQNNLPPKRNGYYITGAAYLFIILGSIAVYFIPIHFLPFNEYYYHSILTVVCTLIPLSNFVMYFIKANSRANNCLPYLVKGVQHKAEEYEREMKTVEVFIKACDYFDQDFKVTNNGD